MLPYKSPPVIEVVCEFRFSSSTEWDQNTPDKLFEILKSEYSEKRTEKENQINIATNGNDIQKASFGYSNRYIFSSINKNADVKIGEKFLSIHAKRPYIGWESFFQEIQVVHQSLLTINSLLEYDRIGLLYVNRLEFPFKEVTFSDYLNFYPTIGEKLPNKLVNFQTTCDFEFENGRDVCRLNLTSRVPQRPDLITFLLITDYFLVNKKGIKNDEVYYWIENAHQQIWDIFNNILTEKMKMTFN